MQPVRSFRRNMLDTIVRDPRQHLNEQHAAYSVLIQRGQYERALEVARQTGDRQGEGFVLAHLGTAYQSIGELQRAIAMYEQALEIAREIGDRRGEGNILAGLAGSYAGLRQLDNAIVLYSQALAIAREVGDGPGVSDALTGLANCRVELHRLVEAGTLPGPLSVALLQQLQAASARPAHTDAVPNAADDPLAAAKRRGEIARRGLLAAQGELLGAAEAAARLGVSQSEVDRRRVLGQLIALPIESGAQAFPSWQFVDGGLLPGLEAVLRDIGVRDPWMQAAYFLSGDIRLDGQTPLEMLRRGEAEAVRRAAAAYGEQLAS
jgi:hypothetical protein